MERESKKGKAVRRQLFSLILALAMVLTSVAVPTTTAEAAKKVKVKKVQITSPKKKTVTLVKGQTLQIKVKVTPSKAKNKKVTYKSSKKKIASVTSKGKVKGIKKGTAKITVTAKDGSKKKATLTVKVINPVKVKKIKLNKTSITIEKGRTYNLKATVTPKNATNKAVSWATSSKKIATVTSKGKVKGIKKGNAKITVTAKDGSKKKATCNVKVVDPVSPVKVTKVELNKTSITIGEGETYKLTASVTPNNAANKAVSWATSDKQIATVTSQGEVKGIKSGAAKITATAKDGSGKKATCNVEVKAATPPAEKKLDSIEVTTPPAKVEYIAGEKLDLAGMVVTAKYTDGTTKVLEAGAYTTTPAADAILSASNKQVTVAYTEGVKKTTRTPITVIGVEGIRVKTPPTKVEYNEDDTFDPAGMVVEAVLKSESGEEKTREITGYTYPTDKLAVTAGAQYTKVKISYKTGSSTVEETETNITVKSKDNELTGLTVRLLKTEPLPRADGCFQDDDVEVTATFKKGDPKKLSVQKDCQVTPAKFTKDTKEATVTYWYGGKSESKIVTGFTVTEYREKYAFDNKDTSGILVKRADEGSNGIPTEDNTKNIEPTFENGLVGKAMKMDGTYGVWLDKIAGTDSKSYSVSMWVKPEAFKTSQALVISTSSEFGFNNNPDGETWCGVAGEDANGKLKLWSHEPVSKHVTPVSSVKIDKNKWSHIVLVVDGTTTKEGTAPGEGSMYSLGTLYVNGKKAGSGNIVNEKANGRGTKMKTYFGANAWKDDGYFKGLVDEFVFTNEVLKESDVEKYYMESAVAAGHTYSELTSVSPDDGAEVEVPYGTSLSDVKEALQDITYKAKAADGTVKEIKPVSDTLTADDYSVDKTGQVTAKVELKAPAGCLFNIGGTKSFTVMKTVKVKIVSPVTITAITPSANEVRVPYNSSDDAIKAELAKLTFTVTTSDQSSYAISNAASSWTLAAKAADGSRTATFTRPAPKPGYKYADNIAAVTVAVKEDPAVTITALAADPAAVEVSYNTPADAVKTQLARKVAFRPTVAQGQIVPAIPNTAELWDIADYNGAESGEYNVKATVQAPAGYKFASGDTMEVSVKVTVAAKGEHVLTGLQIQGNYRKVYIEGDKFDKTGMTVNGIFADGEPEDVTAKVTVEDKELGLSDDSVTISCTVGTGDNERTVTETVGNISVVKVEEGMAAHYDFEETLEDKKGGAAAKMVTKGDTMGTMAGTDNANYKQGIKGKGILLGEGDDSSIIRLGRTVEKPDFTINFWAKPKTLTRTYAQLLAGLKENLSEGEFRKMAIHTCVGSGRKDVPAGTKSLANSFLIYNGGEKVVSDVWETGSWSMVTWSNSAGKTTVYVNGEQVYQEDNRVADVANIFVGGGKLDGTFNGYVDEVSIYDSSLSEKQVKKLYGKPVISGLSVDAEDADFTFLKSALTENAPEIQIKLKALKINVAMLTGKAPEIANDTDWTLNYDGNAGEYTATKVVAIPEGYDKTEGLETTLSVKVTVNDAKLDSIRVSKNPDKMTYLAGETFDKTGMEVTASYTAGVADKVVGADKVTVVDENKLLTPDDGKETCDVTVKYAEGDAEKTAKVTVNVKTLEQAAESATTTRTAYYTFEDSLANLADKENSAAATWVKNSNASEAGTSTVAYAQGKKGKGLQVGKDGATDILKLDKDVQSPEFTINLWVKASKSAAGHNPVVCVTTLTKWERTLMIYAMPDTATRMKIFAEGLGEREHENVFSTEDWVMLTWVNTNGRFKLYKNGELLAEYECGIQKLPNIFLGGAGGAFEDPVFEGVYDEVSIFSTPLEDWQVKGLYKSVDAQ